MSDSLSICPQTSLQAENGGLFVATTPTWVHPERIIGSYELIYVKDGVLSLWEEDRHFEVSAGESLLLYPGRKHYGAKPSPRNLRFYWAHFTLASETIPTNFQSLGLIQHVRIARPDHMTALFRRFLDDQELFGTRSVTLSLLLMLMACEVSRSTNLAQHDGSAASLLASKANVVIQTKFQEQISTSSIAEELHCNSDYLGRIFKSIYGKTLTDAINERRMRHAASLLSESHRGVDEIAKACGYNDLVYFRRTFKRIHGLTPRAFRSLYTRVHINNK